MKRALTQGLLALGVAAVALRVAAQTAPRSDAGVRAPPDQLGVPGLDTSAALLGDGRPWQLTTRLSPEGLQVTAVTSDGAMALVVRRTRESIAGCRSQLLGALELRSGEPPRPPTISVFRGALWASEVARVNSTTHDGELSCLRVQTEYWLATALVRAGLGATLLDLEPVAQRLGAALARPGVRTGWPVRLHALGLELGDPGDGAPWLLTGPTAALGFAAEGVSSGAGNAGGVTVQLGRRAGTCAALWDALRTQSEDFGAVVDRPGYVPALFGARGRRVLVGERTREWFCAERAGAAWMASTVFRTDDGDALGHAGALLRSAAQGIEQQQPERARDAGAEAGPGDGASRGTLLVQ